MKKQSKQKGKKKSIQLRQDILNVFNSNRDKQLNYKQISSLLEINDKELRKLIFSILNDLTNEGILAETQRGKFKFKSLSERHEGIFDSGRKGKGYVIVEDLEKDIFIDAKDSGKALHGDRVIVELLKSKNKKGKSGRIVEVLNQKDRLIVGTLQVDDHFAFLIPDNHRIDKDIFIPKSELNDGIDGFKAIAKITDWPDSAKNPFGKIVDVLGRPESNDAEMKSILTAYGINYEFPEQVLTEANRIDLTLDPKEIEKRRDFRDVLTFTIDPVDAKDFDDAISFEKLENGLIRLGVHIADVAHYVQEDSAIDIEAKERGNSVYLVDRVIPMLPEHLSNGVCSLRPNEEKFAFSAVFDLNEKGEIQKEWFGRTTILSKRRFTYEEAQEIIESGKGELSEELTLVNSIAKQLRSARMQNGALEIHGSELRFELDEKGKPVATFKKTQKDANKLIEEFMLLANKRVGRFVGNTQKKQYTPLIYRIHDKPDLEKVGQFSVFVSKFGENFSYKDERDIAKEMNRLFAKFKDENEFDLIQQMAIKSMAKAIYDTENIGHYGLGFEYYAHFTSPIRRYADLMVHRILFNELNKINKRYADLQKTAEHISITERKAAEAERASKKYFQALYLEDKEGEVFAGNITGLTDWGIYVELEDNFCEGMVPLKSLKGDRFIFDEDDYIVYGQRSGEKFNLGDRVMVKVIKVNLNRKQIDLQLMD